MSLLVETYQICPYTGLRSFSEEESLYFKGRENDIDQACNQLQRNKFLMLTGASGDGKSSLIYAGIIPNARAGFLKSKYSQWCVADFRPERTPFQNLCKSIARELEIANPLTVQSELSHGFSALVDLYKNSKRYIDAHSPGWQNAGQAARTRMKNEAANLIILVDQFEEFFTNPENYHHGACSRDANVVVNILLETARIALEEDLPIYVIFTMRSDYIGQCAAFRGLPEYIGFSQFFVPHLNRSQLQQVIEEPATLSGNRITRRLTERLILDLTEGVDQLPILQHALNQVWVAADKGNEEMDLVHYAMVGGMSRNELPAEHVDQFDKWFNALPPEIKACYSTPSLQNVLDTHTNKLYLNAARYYWEQAREAITTDEAKMLIRTAFTCLTKIDQGRAVRNRMTLQEIVRILGIQRFDTRVLGTVLNIFREPGNTFIRPFINADNPESRDIQPGQVLEITHESLIRNWQYLGRWAKEEFDSLSVYNDLEQQVKRWVQSGKSGSFLLPIGPLTFFENWYKKAKPNEWWIARYLPEDTGKEVKQARAEETISDTREFLGLSARKHFVTRALVRYGTKRIALTLGLITLLTLTSFVVKSYFSKQNGNVLNAIRKETIELVNNPKVTNSGIASLVCEQMKMGRITIDDVVRSIDEPIRKINVINAIASMLVFQGAANPKAETRKSLAIADSLLESLPLTGNVLELSRSLNEINDNRVILELAYYHSPDSFVNSLRKSNALRSARWVKKILESQPAGFSDFQNLHLALENAINHKAFSMDEIKKLLLLLSPFENGLQTAWLRENYAQGKPMIRGLLVYGFYFNGLYQELAYLYAASGNSQKALQCIDSLLKYSQNNFQGDYSNGSENASHIASVFYTNGQEDQLEAFVSGYCERKQINKIEFYERLIGRSFPGSAGVVALDLYAFMQVKMNLNVQFMGREQLSYFFARYRESIQQLSKDSAARNYLLALAYKLEGILKSRNNEIPKKNELSVTQLFGEAVSYYNKVSRSYLEATASYVGRAAGEPIKEPRKFLFIYPDLRTVFHPMEPRSFYFFYSTDEFMKYILDNNLFAAFYPGKKEIDYVTAWINDYHSIKFGFPAFLGKEPRYDVLEKVAEELSKNAGFQGSDFNLLYLYVGQAAQHAGDSARMLRYYDKIKIDRILNVLRVKEFGGNINHQAFRMISRAAGGLAKSGQFEKAIRFVTVFKNPVNRSSLYAHIALNLFREQHQDILATRFADSALAEMNRAQDISMGQPNRRLLASTLTMQDPKANLSKANMIIKNIEDKFNAICGIARSMGFYEKLYQARTQEPAFLSDADRSVFLWNILIGYDKVPKTINKDWDTYDKSYFPNQIDFLQYLDESN